MNDETLSSTNVVGQEASEQIAWFEKLRLWFSLSRPKFHLVGLLPYILGYLLASFYGHSTSWQVMILGGLGVVLIMLVTYYLGEYFDYEGDTINRSFNAFSGGTRALQTGQIKRSSALAAGLLLLIPIAAIGLALQFYYNCGSYTLLLGAVGIAAGAFYSAKPVQWAYHGVGEVLIGLAYGWLTVNTGYYLQVGRFDLVSTFVALPIMTSIAAVILINEFPDYEADKVVRKNNLVVLLGPSLATVLYFILVLSTLTFSFLTAVVAFSFPYKFLPLILVPVVLKNLLIAQAGKNATPKELESLCAGTLLLNMLVILLPLVCLIVELTMQIIWLETL
ncbi:MAG: hypothetical protein DRH70_03145 [Candidatus Coatesbacteria bacterium]|nr:MAG: hypothetical protein DRH70_03145 [Candidatus Coatesbacteria bacterium]